MRTKFTWEGFENREFCVDFKNEADKMEFLKECEKRGYKWFGGTRPTKQTVCSCYSNAEIGTKKLRHSSSLPIAIYLPHPIEPVITRQDKFLEVFNLSKEGLRNGTIDLRPCDILGKYEKCGDFKACYRCRENYWSQPYKEKDK